MAFSWDGRFALCRIEEVDPNSYRVYMHSDSKEDINDSINVIDRPPVKASMAAYDAIPVTPPAPWNVKIVGVDDPVRMGVFQLKKK